MISDFEKSLKQKLKNIANENAFDINELWSYLVTERFLARLARSKYRDNLILKGGFLLAKYVTLERETVDVDFLGKNIKDTKNQMVKILKDISEIKLDDHFTFHDLKISELPHMHMPYPGFRASLTARLEKIKIQLNIDIGFGDEVGETEMGIPLLRSSKGALFEEQISLLVYPPEAIFAEKLETLVDIGSINSRMKDYYDLYMLIKTPELIDRKKALRDIKKTFQNRQTELKIPITFDEQQLETLQKRWSTFHNKMKSPSIPKDIGAILDLINDWLRN